MSEIDPNSVDGDVSTSPPSGHPRWGRIAMWLLAASLAGAGAWQIMSRSGAAPAHKGSDAAARIIPVVAEATRTADMDIQIAGLGTVTPRNAVTVRSRVDGQLMRVLFREGQMVKAGDLLAEIDPRPFQVQLAQAEGQKARDLALLQNARVDLERYRTLLAQDSIPHQQLDTQESLVRQYEAAVRSDQAQIDDAKLQLVYARITAPIAGRLGLRQVDPGNIVRASDTNGLVSIAETQPITVVFPIPEDQLPAVNRRLHAGETLAVTVWDREGLAKLATGTLLTTDNQIDPTTGTIKLKAQFANGDGALFPNQFVNVKLKLDTLHAAVVAPSAAVQRGTQGSFVYIVTQDNTAAVRPVKLGPADGQNVAIASGLEAGEMVVVDGADKLRDGARIQLAQREAPGAPAAGSRGGEGHKPRRQQNGG